MDAQVLKNVPQFIQRASYREVSTSVGNVLTAVSDYFYIISASSKHFPSQSVFSRNITVNLTIKKIFLCLNADISPTQHSKYHTIQNSGTKSRVYTVKERLSSGRYYFQRTKPEIPGEALTALTFEH